jgi:type I restriction enzyme, S subunit
MEVKQGYKQTEVGIIPQEWSVKSVHEIGQIKTGPFGTLLKASEYSDNEGVPLISVGEVGAGNFRVTAGTPRIPANVVRRLPQYVLRSGDIVFGRKGAVDRSALVSLAEDGWFLGSDGISIRPNSKCHPPYLAAQFQSQAVQSWLIQNAIGTTMPSLNQGILSRVQIPYASDAEQRAIAAALSDMDALLDGLERLIAKKRDLKQAAMQQLLTGQIRLPGNWVVNLGYKQTEVGLIPEDWDVQPFKERFNISAGGDVNPKLSSSVQDEEHCYPIYSNALTDRGLYGYCSYADHPANSITITARGSLGFATFRDHKYTAIGRVLVLHPKRQSAGMFFAEFISCRVKFAIESTGVPQLTAPQISEYYLAVPSFAEQTAIATALSDMDGELSALEARRNKTRALKQAMMQELLTGKTRLVTPSSNAVALDTP